MEQKITGIVLHTLKYNDTSNIVDIYTEQSGRASFLVKIPRSRKSGVQAVLFQPLSIIEVEADVRPTNGLHRVREAKSLYPFSLYATTKIWKKKEFSSKHAFFSRNVLQFQKKALFLHSLSETKMLLNKLVW